MDSGSRRQADNIFTYMCNIRQQEKWVLCIGDNVAEYVAKTPGVDSCMRTREKKNGFRA